MRIYIKSCHASLEYDQALMFLRMGHLVAGSFDVGSNQRPKIKGVTDVSYPLEDAIEGGADMVVLHQVEDYSHVFECSCKAMGKRPVILHAFGQGCKTQHAHTVRVCVDNKNAYVVAYSITDYNRFMEMGMPIEKCAMIRFGKELSEFKGDWTGRMPVCYMTCNSILRRGDGCGISVVKNLIEASTIPLLITGRETSQVSLGVDDLSYAGMRNLYKQARCYLAIGTQPAPYTLTPVEAMCSGTPVVAYNNGCGIVNEGFPVLVANSAREINDTVSALIENRQYASMWSIRSLNYAKENFEMEIVANQWQDFMDTMI